MKKILLYITLIAVGAFLWWAFSPLLLDKEIQDELDPILKARLEAQRQVDARNKTATGAIDSNDSNEPDTATETTTLNEDAGVFATGPFPIVSTPNHPATGELEIVYSPEETLLYYKNYRGTNGPDLKIYLAKDLDAKEYIDLGPAKGNQGDIIYGLPMDVDLDDYKYVLTWCEAFDVLFDYAIIE